MRDRDALYKWELMDQIGAVHRRPISSPILNHVLMSLNSYYSPSLKTLVTVMRKMDKRVISYNSSTGIGH